MPDIAKRKTDIGPPHYEQFLPPVIKANYGAWRYHEILRPACSSTWARPATGSTPCGPGRRAC